MIEILQKIQSELKAPKNQKNTFGNYNYRSCEDILEAVKPLLAKYSAVIIINDEMVAVGDRIYVKATATIYCGVKSVASTAYAREGDNKKGMDDAQLTGATSSYARKYALNGLLCIDDTKDADATNKHDNAPAPQQQSNEPEKEWYNDFEKHKGTMLAKLDSGEYKDPAAIIAELSKKFKINKKVRESINGLTREIDEQFNAVRDRNIGELKKDMQHN